MSDPMPVMILAYAPSGTAPVMIGTQTIRRGLTFKNAVRLSGVTSFSAGAATSITFTSAGFSSMMPLQIRFKVAGTLRISQEPAPGSSLTTAYSEYASNTFTEWENCADCYLYGRKMFARQGSAGAVQYEIQAVRRIANGAQ